MLSRKKGEAQPFVLRASSGTSSTFPMKLFTAPPSKCVITVAEYLQQRLEELGLTRLYGVPGNYTAPFLNTELVADYAADAYARV